MILPHDYVNYTKLSWSDIAGIKHPLYPTKHTSNPTIAAYQNSDGDFSLTAIGDLVSTSSDIVLDGDTFSGTSNGEYIPEHSGLLFILTFDTLLGEDVCFDSSSITTSANIQYEAILDECIHVNMGCTDIYGLN